MRRTTFILVLLYFAFLSGGSVYGTGESRIVLGSTASWNLIDSRYGVTEASQIRPHPVLLLDSRSFPGTVDPGLTDIHLSFDEEGPWRFMDPLGRYDISISPGTGFVTAPLSRVGAGAALFPGNGRSTNDLLVLRPQRGANFASGNHLQDFSIEFWLCPQNLDNGEQILTMVSALPDGRGGFLDQNISCVVSRNRLTWIFNNFFFFPGSLSGMNITLTGSPILNRSWSHHLIRFDADLGILEYLVDGRLEALEYVTSNGRESGQVYTPIIGEDNHFILGSRFAGMIDEFRINNYYSENSALTNFPRDGGRVVSHTFDLGYSGSRVLMLEAFGGRTQVSSAVGRVQNEYAGNSSLRFSDFAEIRFFIRYSNNPYSWNNSPWISVSPGTTLSDTGRGRYMQVAADFYPGMNGNTSPYLEEIVITYHAAEPPLPPTMLTAVAQNGAVELSWRASPSMDVSGYMIYYGTASGEYFGNRNVSVFSAMQSPINAGNRTSFRIDGLANGTIYYFAVAAYYNDETDRLGEPGRLVEPGAFSRETAARPLAN